MTEHIARFPGITNDPKAMTLTSRQAARLATLSAVPETELQGQSLDKVSERLRGLIDPKLLAFRRICGRVVKPQANGAPLPVPFATVEVYDTDVRLLAWSPPESPFSWFYPFGTRRELLATVTTDECGRFCVWVPRFDIDHYLSWRLERRCYLSWLRKPTILDLLREREVIPQPFPGPDPSPVIIDEHVLTHAARVVDSAAVRRLRTLATLRPGALRAQADAALDQPAFSSKVRPPMPADTAALLEPKLRSRLAMRLGLPPETFAKLDPRRYFGPFIRCHTVIVPQWTTVLDIPDLTFEVKQDVDGDGVPEVIYREGLFDVRWNAGALGEVVLEADPIAISSPSCDIPDVGPCGDPAILFAGNYPLQVPATPSPFHDAITGYALLPNRPDENGIPYEGNRTSPSEAPFTGKFYLVGCAERPDATHYRVHHQVGGGSSFLNGSFGPLVKVVGGVLHQRHVSPVDGQWYPIIPRAEGWTPVGILAPVDQLGDHLHTFRLEFGSDTSGTVQVIANSLTPPVNVHIDTTAPRIDTLELAWRRPDGSATGWTPLPIANCAVIDRGGAQRVQLRLRLVVSANHLRDFSVTPGGCGPTVAPSLITDGRDGLPIPAADAAAHWHTGPTDDTHTRELFYELPAAAPAGCYRFTIQVNSRAFNPTEAVAGLDPVAAWTIDRNPIYVHPTISVALQ